MQSLKTTITTTDVDHIAKLAAIPITTDEAEKLAVGFTATMEVVDTLKSAHTEGVEPTHQVTGLENVWREDIVDEDRTFSQEEALRNGRRTHNGFFVVNQILDK